MSGYAIKFQDKAFTPEGREPIEDVEAHNKAVEFDELTTWASQPDRFYVYVVQPKLPAGQIAMWYEAQTWLGTSLGCITYRRSFRGNISRNMVAIRFTGTNGAEYYGRYGADWSQLCRVRKVKPQKQVPIYEGQQMPEGPKTWLSTEYRYSGKDADSGLHVFITNEGRRELFAKRRSVAGWHLIRGKFCYEFCRGELKGSAGLDV